MNSLTNARLMTRAVELICLDYLPDHLSLEGRFVRELIVNGGLFEDTESENVSQDFDYFRAEASKGTGGNLGIDRYYLTGKSATGEQISMDITHYPNDHLARINFNNLELDEVEQWFMSLDRSLTTNECDEQTEKVEEI
jgi:hypothetical protein